MTNPEDPAFSTDRYDPELIDYKPSVCVGLTKREWYAGQAMVGVSIWDALINDKIHAGTAENLARSCVALADALIAELNKTTGVKP